jgi:hypothetical protein
MTPDKRIEWCRENIPGFKAMNDQAEKARMETEQSRERLAAYLTGAYSERISAKQEERTF